MTEWFYAIDGEQHGPFPEDELRQRFLDGELSDETWVWAEGMAGWSAAQTVPELQAMFSTPPPMPPTSPTPPPVPPTPPAGDEG